MKTMAEFAEGVVKEIETSGECRPRIYVISTDGIFMHFDYDGEPASAERTRMQNIIKGIVVSLRILGTFESAAFLGEAWVSQQLAGQPRKYERCEDDPERREMVFFISYEKDLTRRYRMWELKRDAGAVKLDPLVPYDKYETWFDEPFGEMREPDDYARACARRAIEHLRQRQTVKP